MKNRDRYISGRNEYDLLMEIAKNSINNECPIQLVSGKFPEGFRLCYAGFRTSNSTCSGCIQKWLNEDEK